MSFPSALWAILGVLFVVAKSLYTYVRYRRSLQRGVESFWSYLFGGIVYPINRGLRQDLAARFNLRRYAEHQLRISSSSLLVPGIEPVVLDIDKVYIPQVLHTDTGHSVTHEQLRQQHGLLRCVVTGDPGSGKSSLIKRLYRDACIEAIANPRRAPLPVTVELRDFVSSSSAPIGDLGEYALEQLRQRIIKVEGYKMARCFDTYLRGAGILLLLDGLDEVPSEQYENVEAALMALTETLANSSAKSCVIITMRTQLYVQIRRRLNSHQFESLSIQPFSLSDMYEFLTRWPFASNRDSSVGRILSYLSDQPTLRDMCTNPLVLSMYVANDERGNSQVVPETRSEFYRLVVDELLVFRRTRGGAIGPGLGALKRERQSVLGAIAFSHLRMNSQIANSIPLALCLDKCMQIWKLDHAAAETKLFELSRDTGLFTMEKERETIRFIHLTFCEFLAAVHVVEQDFSAWARLLPPLNRSRPSDYDGGTSGATRWTEVIAFASALLPQRRRRNLFGLLVRTGERSLLLKCARESQDYAFPEVQAAAISELDDLATASSWDALWMQRVASLVALVRDMERVAIHVVGSAPALRVNECLTRLVNSKDRFMRLFRLYLHEDPYGVLVLSGSYDLDIAELAPTISGAADEPGVYVAIRQYACHSRPRRMALDSR